MRQHVAFDVSKPSNEAMIVDEAGRCPCQRKARTDPAVMAAFVHKRGEDVVLAGFETGRTRSGSIVR